MNEDERRLIDDLFRKLASVEREGPERDREADRYIREQVARLPGAPYYMAQAIVVQERALEAAKQRIDALEAQARQRQSGGFLSGLFGGGRQEEQAPPPRRGGAWGGGYGRGGDPYGRGGGGFLAGAAQTAMGVAGGVLLGGFIGSLFAGDAFASAEDGLSGDAGDAGFDPGADVADAGPMDDGGGFDFGGGDVGGDF
jgi:hypothetical protein